MRAQIPVCSFMCALGIIAVYLLSVTNKLMKDIIDKDDPFDNAHLISMLIICYDMQNIIFNALLLLVYEHHAES